MCRSSRRTPVRAPLWSTALLAGLVAASPARGQDDRAGALVLEAPSSTSAMAFGEAAYLFGVDPGLLFHAPALVGRTRGIAVGLQRYDWEGTLASAAGSTPLFGGRLAAGFQYLRYGTDAGPSFARDIQSAALTAGDVGIAELAASIGYARTVRGIEAGVVLKHVEQDVGGVADGSLALDLGLARELGPLMVSFTARNLGPDLAIPGGESGELELPTQVTAGVSVDQFEVGPLDMFVTGRLTRRRDSEVVPGGGLEISYWPVTGYTFRLRGGIQRVVDDGRSPFTLGAAFTGDDITIEWALQPFDAPGSAHRFGLSWR